MKQRYRSVLLLILILAAGSGARAQELSGNINGVVSDSTGAILPGVEVTLTSPAIQGARSQVTDESGNYRFNLLPPGTFTVKYELSGFKTLIREGLIVAVGRTVTVNVLLEVATLAETVTVTGESPVVDVQNATVGVTFNQSLLANLPNARDIWVVLSQTPGVQTTRFDVGGSTMGTQTGYRTYGRTAQNWVTLDGVATTEGTSGAGMYYDYGSFSEITVTGAANSAEVAVPGAYINTVMKTGGNQLKGEAYFDWEDDSFQGKNLTDELRRGGVDVGDAFIRYNDFNFNVGGPFKKDKFWWFTSIRDQYSALQTQLRFNDGTPGASFTTRLTNQSGKFNYQINENNQIIYSTQRNRKVQPYRNGQGATARNYIINSTQIQDSWYLTSKGQWTSVLSNRATLDVSVSNYFLYDPRKSHVEQTPWEDTVTGAIRGGLMAPSENWRYRWQYGGNLGYFKDNFLGGNHDFRFGYGIITEQRRDNDRGAPGESGTPGHVRLTYANGVADFFRVTDTPVEKNNRLFQNYAFIQDKWTIGRRLTLSLGLRFDRYTSWYPQQGNNGAGPFSQKTDFPKLTISTFNDFVPRISIVYDLFGTTKTAIKASYGRYAENTGTLVAEAVNPIATRTFQYRWDGTLPVTPAVVSRSTLQSITGQIIVPRIDPDLKNGYTDEFTLGFEHEIVADFGLSGLFVRKLQKRPWGTIDQAYLLGDYAPVGAIDPGPDGRIGSSDDRRITVFERTAPTRPSDRLLTNHDLGANFSTVEFTATKRFSKGWQLLSGFDWTKINLAPPISTDPNVLLYGLSNAVATGPNQHQTTWSYKASGTRTLPRGFEVSGTFTSQKGEPYYRSAQFLGTGRNLLNPDGSVRTTSLRQGTVQILTEPNGSRYLPTVYLTNIRAQKKFAITERQSIEAMFDLFNVFNANTILGRENLSAEIRDSAGTLVPRFDRPNTILNPRIFRLGVRYRF